MSPVRTRLPAPLILPLSVARAPSAASRHLPSRALYRCARFPPPAGRSLGRRSFRRGIVVGASGLAAARAARCRRANRVVCTRQFEATAVVARRPRPVRRCSPAPRDRQRQASCTCCASSARARADTQARCSVIAAKSASHATYVRSTAVRPDDRWCPIGSDASPESDGQIRQARCTGSKIGYMSADGCSEVQIVCSCTLRSDLCASSAVAGLPFVRSTLYRRVLFKCSIALYMTAQCEEHSERFADWSSTPNEVDLPSAQTVRAL
ncbi:MAG: hypothetical protein JWN04_2011 [Myxococcaceae bacterium]|nr:hypothetical protein [Myxococcaceae bacterium]